MLLAARGLGVMVAMAASGRMMEKIDPRLMVFAGFVMMALSLWYMTGWSLEMDWHPVVWTGLLQGVGLGLVFVPLNVMSFATLPSEYRTDGAGLLSLSRNLGESLGLDRKSVVLGKGVSGRVEFRGRG